MESRDGGEGLRGEDLDTQGGQTATVHRRFMECFSDGYNGFFCYVDKPQRHIDDLSTICW